MNTNKKEDQITLEILGAIDENSDVSQRHIAMQLGVALGLANSYLKRCARKGLIKIKQAPANRYIYYLTPKGFSEKSRLTAQYLTTSFSFYREASDSCSRSINTIVKRGVDNVLLCGASELAEIASLRASENSVKITGVYDPSYEKKNFLGKKVSRNLGSIKANEVCLLTSIKSPVDMYQDLVKVISSEQIVVPDVIAKLLGRQGS
jgi:predicted transcriptional regulator